MANKTQLIFGLSQDTAKTLSSSHNWTAFLKSASWQYKYPFQDQLLIYAQRPDSTACANIDVWNNKLHRWINRGSKGIALLSEQNGNFKLKYVFDVSDTNSYHGNELKLWQYDDKYDDAIIETLQNTFGELDVTATITDAVVCAAHNAVQDNKADYLHELNYAKENSFLEELDDFNVNVAFEKIAAISVAYMVLNRLGIHPDEIFMPDEFTGIMDFNTPETISVLGNATSAIAETALINISETIQATEHEEKLQTKKFAEKKEKIYNDSRNKNERNDTNDKSINIQDGGRLSDTRPDVTGGQSERGQIRLDAQNVHQAEQTEPIQQSDDNGQIDRLSDRFGQAGEVTSEPNSIKTIENREATRQGNRPDGMGTGDEQPQPFGGGNSPYGTGVQLSLFPTEEQQQNTVRKAEQANFKGSAFSMPISQQMIDEVLCDGGNQQNSKLRICTQYQKQKSLSENTYFLKNEYGKGGKGFVFGVNPVSVWFDEGGIQITYGKENKANDYTLTWEQAAKRVGELLDVGRYMPQDEIDMANFNERKELADKIWYLHQDSNEYFPLDEVMFEGGFPESTTRIAESLNNPEKRNQIIAGISEFAKAYAANRNLLRYHFHRPTELSEKLSELLIERKQFTAAEPVSFGGKRFITQNEIDSALKRGSGFESGKMRIYSFFTNEKDDKKRINFLRNAYGTGGGTHAMNGVGYEDHDGKGITLSRGDICMPYDKLTLSWTQVAKRIDTLIKSDGYLSQEDIGYIPKYEKDQIASDIYYFYYKFPMETPCPFPYGFSYYDAKKIIVEMLSDTENTAETLAQMKSLLLETSIEDENYATRKSAVENLEKYVAGEYALFGKLSKPINVQEKSNLSPIWVEYQNIKKEYPDSIALMQVGDFLEFYGDDAKTAAEILGITLMEREIKGLDNRQPMCGIPSHHLDEYLGRLTDNGYTVALRGKDDMTGEITMVKIVSDKEKQTENNDELFSLKTKSENYSEEEIASAIKKINANLQIVLNDKNFYSEQTKQSVANTLSHGILKHTSSDFFRKITNYDQTHNVITLPDNTHIAYCVDNRGVFVTTRPELCNDNFVTAQWASHGTLTGTELFSWEKVSEAIFTLCEYQIDGFIVSENEKTTQPDDIPVGKEKQYDLGYGYLGNGQTIWNRLEEVDNDYKTVAHIDDDGNVSFYDEDMPESVKAEIQEQADAVKQKNIAEIVTKMTIEDMAQEDEFLDNQYSDDELANIYGGDTANAQKEIVEQEITDNSDLIGKIVTMNDRRFLIESVSDFSGNVSMRDLTFQEQAGFPISRVESVDFVRQFIKTEEKEPEALTPHFEKPKQNKIPNTLVYPQIPMSDRHNFTITDDELGYGGAKEKFRNNMEAIILLKQIELDERLALPSEQEILSHYVGWGGLPDAFDENKSNWASEYLQLKAELAPDEYEQARASTLNAHYTSPTVIKAMYKALENIGQQGAAPNSRHTAWNILEPACGIGNFMGLVPESMADSKLYGIELDSITGRIAQQLYQKNSIAIQGYEDTLLPDSFFDVAIGNVPFGNYKVVDKKYDKNNFLIHDFFFAKTLDKVRPGGVVAFITSSGTMDKKSPAVRKYLAQRADLLGAIRLPNNAFLKNAGTQVTADILFLQKRDRMTDIEPEWVHLGTDENGFTINSYFVDNPDMILGEMSEESTQYGMDITCKPYEDTDLAELLEGAIQNIHGQITEYEFDEISDEEDLSIPADPTVRNFSYTVVDGDVYFRENSRMNKIETAVTALNRIKGMIEIRDCVRALIEYQTEDYSEYDIKKQQVKLDRLYDDFTKKYGLINSRGNNVAFSDDSSYFLLCSLEILNENGELERKADMFTKRTIGAKTVITKVDTATESLAVSLNEKARIDMDYMSSLTGKTELELYEELKGVIFYNPMHTAENDGQEKYITADEYLSGNVREKLEWAKRTAQLFPDDYTLNVEALTAIQPKDLTASEITVRLGATWIPPEYIRQFTFELLETSRWIQKEINVHYSKLTGDWNISRKSSDRGNVMANSTYGTGRIGAYKIIEDTLNLKDVRIFDYVENENGNKVAVLNRKETTIAQQKQDLIKSAFDNWIWKDPHRREKLTTLYNEKFNSNRPREYDGSHITFNGMSPEISLRQHQKNAVARGLYGGNSLYGHVVGSGKTWTMTALAMESKRLGLCNKSLFVVPNHLTEQWASEFLQLYPSANILVSTKKDFETKNRKKFCGRIATGDYDAVIIGHSQFEKIPMSAERQRIILENQMDEILMGINDLKRANAENFSIKQLEKTRRNLEVKLKKLNDQSRKDNVVTFEELGIDRIFIDEAHYYKNLFLFTKMRNVGGIAQTEAQKSSDLFMKCRYLDELTGGKGIIFATGTPISNSMVELYTMQRYLQYETLARNDLQHFDAWASTFGETVTAIELAPEGTGYRAKTRFAKFYNLPELMAMFKEVADIQTTDMLNLPVPEANYKVVAINPSELQKQMVEDLANRAERVRNRMVEPNEDNMLKITNDGRKLALDQRLMNDMLPDDENSKVAICANNVFEIWQESRAERLTQLVFCDLSTPHYDGKFNVYDDLKNKLMAQGMPKNEIAFIHDADNEVKKKEMFSKVRKGLIRVMIGSTPKMGAGTNVQKRLIALHDIDCPWRPSDLEQRAGRIIRQGNKNEKVFITRYVTKDTFDAYLFQLIENKQKFIAQIMTSKSPVRSAEDIDETALSYAEIKALATGNPHIKEKMDLDTQVAKLKLIKSSFLSQKYELEDRVIKHYPREIKEIGERISGYEKDIKMAAQHPKKEDKFNPMTIDGTTHYDKEKAGKALIERCKLMTSPDEVKIGNYRDFSMLLSFNTFSNVYHLTMKNELSHTVSLGSDVFGNIQRIDNVLEGMNAKQDTCKENLEEVKKQYEIAKVECTKEFPQENELAEKSSRLAELDALLNMDKPEHDVVDADFEADDYGEDTTVKSKKYEMAR